jgi:carotenoid cleavage dioxygenase-like enzyme
LPTRREVYAYGDHQQKIADPVLVAIGVTSSGDARSCGADHGHAIADRGKTIMTGSIMAAPEEAARQGVSLEARGRPVPVDRASNPDLNGPLSPVEHEIDAADLPVIGRIPDDLRGVYLRNGPNPKFTPLGSYTYPYDGDGMIHGIWLADGKARYRNRHVMSRRLQAEISAGHALWGGLVTPSTPAASELVPHPEESDYRLQPSINIVHHGHRFLALSECAVPYEMTAELDTVGRCDFGNGLPLGMCAHPRIDPLTGEMIVFRYWMDAPYLYWAAIGADGAVTRPPEIIAEIDRGYLIHDFLITEDYVVLVICPATFDLSRILNGGSSIGWEQDRGTRIAVIPRATGSGPTRWIETDAFWCWHYANAWQEGGEIVTVFPWWNHLNFGVGGLAPLQGQLVRARIDPDAGTIRFEVLDDRPAEFPRIDDRLQGRQSNFLTVAHRTPALRAGAFDELLRFDLARGTTVTRRFPGQAIGEAVFAPKAGQTSEAAGYILTFVTDLAAAESRFVILDAEDIAGTPVAEVMLPQRVPSGLHGNWISADARCGSRVPRRDETGSTSIAEGSSMKAAVTGRERNDADILQAALALQPQIRAAARDIEDMRRLPPSLVEALKNAGIFGMAMPTSWGGPQLDPLTQFRVIEALAMADGSVGWCAMINCDGGYLSAFLDDAVGRSMFPDIHSATASCLSITGQATRVRGGYRVSGRFPFASGCLHSDWVSLGCAVIEDDRPLADGNGVPATRHCFVPLSDCEIMDTWYTTGLAGTGSNDLRVDDVFVDEERSFSFQDPALIRARARFTYCPSCSRRKLRCPRSASRVMRSMRWSMWR